MSNGFDTLLVAVDHSLSKGVILCPTKKNITVDGIATIIFRKLYAHFRLFNKAISDCGPQFTANFAKELSCILGYEISLSTAYHPQTDGEMKRLNQEIETSFAVPTLKYGLNIFPWRNLSTIVIPTPPLANPHSTSCWGMNHKPSPTSL